MKTNSQSQTPEFVKKKSLVYVLSLHCAYAIYIPSKNNLYSNQESLGCKLRQEDAHAMAGKFIALDGLCNCMKPIEIRTGVNEQGISISFELAQRTMYNCPKRQKI